MLDAWQFAKQENQANNCSLLMFYLPEEKEIKKYNAEHLDVPLHKGT